MQENNGNENAINIIKQLARIDGASFKDFAKDMVNKYEAFGSLTPKQMSTLTWRLKTNKIKYDPEDFTVNIRDQDEDFIREAEDWQLKNLLPMLSRDDKQRVKELRSEMVTA